MIEFTCGGCGKAYRVKDELAGRQAKCKQCGALMAIPAPAVAPADDPLGLNLDLGALGALGDPMAGAPLGDPLAGGPALGSALGSSALRARPRKKSNMSFWLIIGGTATATLGLLGGAVALAVVLLSGPAPLTENPVAYLPANWAFAGSARLNKLAERGQSVPLFKTQIDSAVAHVAKEGSDIRQMSEVLLTIDGRVVLSAVVFDRPQTKQALFGTTSPSDNHRGFAIYNCAPKSSVPSQQATAVYAVSPNPKLLIFSNDLARLKGAVEQGASPQAPTAIDLSRDRDVSLRIKDVGALAQLSGNPVQQMPGGGATPFKALSLTLDWNDRVTFDAAVEFSDAQTATQTQTVLNLMLAAFRRPAPDKPTPSGGKFHLPDDFKLAANGTLLSLGGSWPTAELIAMLPTAQELMALGQQFSASGQGGLPGGFAPGMPAGFAPPSAAPGLPGQVPTAAPAAAAAGDDVWTADPDLVAQLGPEVSFDVYAWRLPAGFAPAPAPANAPAPPPGVRIQAWFWNGPPTPSGARPVAVASVAEVAQPITGSDALEQSMAAALPSLGTTAQISDFVSSPGKRGQLAGKLCIRSSYSGTIRSQPVYGWLLITIEGQRMVSVNVTSPEPPGSPAERQLEAALLTFHQR